jgi:spermidine synthase
MSIVTSPEPTVTKDMSPPRGDATSLFLVSVAGLFLELMLIRWIGSEMGIFGYLQNAVLVACFLGLGMGCWTSGQAFALRDVLRPLALTVFLLAVIVTWLEQGRSWMLLSFLTWPRLEDYPALALRAMAMDIALALLVLVLCWATFVPVGRLLGRLLDEHPYPIQAYSINIAASLGGIWLFVLLGILYQPPGVWLLVAAVLLGAIGWRARTLGWQEMVLLAAIVGFGWVASFPPQALAVYWSPYQKLTLESPRGEGWAGIGEFIIRVNNEPYQGMLDLRPETIKQHPERYRPELAGLSQYDIPLLLHRAPERVLVVGAGSGNDVAGARRGGAKHITAVDIDPAIISMGRKHHPEQPYHEDGVVQVVNDDARSFFATSYDRFDLIIFGLLDAPLQAGAANVHLDNYVYTRESLERARGLLAPKGVLVLTFEPMRDFIPQRMLASLTEVFGHAPEYFRIPPTPYGWGGVMFVAAEDQESVRRQIEGNSRLSGQVTRWKDAYTITPAADVPIITDDWPYLYLRQPEVPRPYFVLAVALACLFIVSIYHLKATHVLRERGPAAWHFFFLGAAFMLLEVQNISKAAVALGSTWWVNAVIISSILALILLANLIASRLPRLPLAPVYALLIGSCFALYFVDISRFAFLPYATKALVVGLWTSLPMLFSGIVFIRSFAVVEGKHRALGANLLGSLVGGLLQAVTFVTGIKALLLLVAALYLAAFLTRPRATQPTSAPVVEPVAAT